MGREQHSTDDKGGQPPKGSHLIGSSRPGKCGGCNTNGEVEHPYEYHCAETSLAVRVVHAYCLINSDTEPQPLETAPRRSPGSGGSPSAVRNEQRSGSCFK